MTYTECRADFICCDIRSSFFLHYAVFFYVDFLYLSSETLCGSPLFCDKLREHFRLIRASHYAVITKVWLYRNKCSMSVSVFLIYVNSAGIHAEMLPSLKAGCLILVSVGQMRDVLYHLEKLYLVMFWSRAFDKK